jgi:hypothetical protein
MTVLCIANLQKTETKDDKEEDEMIRSATEPGDELVPHYINDDDFC